MPAKSKKQQRFMGMVRAIQKGKMKAPDKKFKDVAKSMKKKDVEDFAGTKHKGLPEKAKKKKSKSKKKKSNLMLIELVKIANELDSRGLVREADALDGILIKAAGIVEDSKAIIEGANAPQGEAPATAEEEPATAEEEPATAEEESIIFYEPKPNGTAHEPYVFKYNVDSDRFQSIEAPRCRGVGRYYGEGSRVYRKLMSKREHWDKFLTEEKVCKHEDSREFSERQLTIVAAIESKTPGSQKHQFGSGHYRYEQPTLAELKWFIENGVRNILRYNGNGGDTETDPDLGVSISTGVESKFANYMSGVIGEKVNFYRLSAHDGYEAGKGYTGSIARGLSILNSGPSLVHCHHGADRTGMIVGAYLKSKGQTDLDALWKYTIKYNSWERNICRGSNFGYAKYLDGFYPLDQWCKKVKSGELVVTSDSKNNDRVVKVSAVGNDPTQTQYYNEETGMVSGEEPGPKTICSNPPVCRALRGLGFRGEG